MDIRTLTSGLAVSPQITPEDIPAIRAAGFRTIFCNRPDGEDADQPAFADIAAAAREAGLVADYIPVVSGSLSDADVSAFGAALRTAEGPVFAYCRSGTRVAMLWALHEAGTRPLREILSTAAAVGYDLTSLTPRIAAAADRPPSQKAAPTPDA